VLRLIAGNPPFAADFERVAMSAAPAAAPTAAVPLSELLDPSREALEPPQCSLFFEPKEWSRRYADTFFTADVVAVAPASSSSAAAPAQPETVEIRVQAADNAWSLHKTHEQFEQLAKQVRYVPFCLQPA
jgi:hypothetical protein